MIISLHIVMGIASNTLRLQCYYKTTQRIKDEEKQAYGGVEGDPSLEFVCLIVVPESVLRSLTWSLIFQ